MTARRTPNAGVVRIAIALAAAWSLPAPVAWSAPAVLFDAHAASTSGGRDVRAVTAAGVVAGPLGDVSLALSRLDDSVAGPARVVGLGLGVGLGSLVHVRAGVARADWDRAPDAWSVDAGPEVRIGAGTFTARYERTRYDDGRTLRGGSLDLEQRLTSRWAARGEASYARGSDGTLARAFLGGARFRAFGPLSVVGEAGVAHDPFGVLAGSRGGASPAPGLVGGILGGPPGADSPDAAPSAGTLRPTVLVGARCILP